MNTDKIKNMSFFLNGLSTRPGQELVRYLSGCGTRLFLSDSNKDVLQNTEEKISRSNCEAFSLLTDNRDPYQVEEAINKAFRTYKTLDCAINNFSLHSIPTNIIDCSVDFLVRNCMSSLSGVFLLMKYELSLLLGLQKPGAIINIFSSNKLIDFENSHATTAYLHAIKGLTLATSNSYAGNGIKIKSFFIQNDETGSALQKNKYIIKDLADPFENIIETSISELVVETIFNHS